MKRSSLGWLLYPALFAMGASCGKNLSQIVFHPLVSVRVADSLSSGLPVPAPIAPADPNHFTFAVFGDVQVRGEDKTMLPRFKQDVGPNQIDFFVVLGDLTEDATSAEFKFIKSALDNVGIPYYVTIGNHDLFQAPADGGWTQYKATFGPATYSVTVASAVRFLLLDTASGEIGPDQFNWLATQLAIPNAAPFTIVGSHYSIYDGFTPLMWRLSSTEERNKLVSMLNKANVYSYVGAHTHAYDHTKVGNVEHFITGSMYPYTLDYGQRGYLLFTFDHGSMSFQRVAWTDVP